MKEEKTIFYALGGNRNTTRTNLHIHTPNAFNILSWQIYVDIHREVNCFESLIEFILAACIESVEK